MADEIDQDGVQHVDAERARAGATPGMTRYILGISLALLIIIFAILVLR
ncbi:hypothetical protein [Sphingomonas sp. DT-204]